MPPGPPADGVVAAARQRRTFAIISHPDAGKTTLTEKLLLYAGAVAEAGAVRAREGRRRVRSDWMALEQERGISISSTVLQLHVGGRVLNLLDTPGHRDFSEDTYRVLAAADAAIMVLDVAKGIEPQTRKLFEVCRARHLPILTFLNKCDRPGRDPLEIVDELEDQLALRATPVTWPVGEPGDLRGLAGFRRDCFVRYGRTTRGATVAEEEVLSPTQAAAEEGAEWARAGEAAALFREVGATLDEKSFLAGESSPLFAGAALTNFGVRHLLEAIEELAPAPVPARDADGLERPLEAPFSGFVFKIQANMDPSHRDRVAFVRTCSGHFERGMTLTLARTGRPFSTKYATSLFGSARQTIDEAYPGDIVGLVNATGVRVGDTLFTGPPVQFPPLATLAPELFTVARAADVSRFKQFRRGVSELEEEGVVTVLRDEASGDAEPMLAAVGQMQFEVLSYRLREEYGVEVVLSPAPYTVARRTDRATADALAAQRSVRVMERRDGLLLALFESPYWLDRLQRDHPEYRLEELVVD